MGVNVLGVEYVGYGMATGKPGERSMYAAADAAYEYLLTRDDVDKAKIVPAGNSIGCAAAIDLASRRPAAGLVCFSAFTTMPAMGRIVIPWLPTSLLLSYKFDNIGKLEKFDGPIFIAHGKIDSIVPFTMSEELRKAARGAVTYVPVEGAGHNDVFDTDEDLLPKLREFLEQVARATSQ
jgi:pimeloyl-ACP methyl ester carboxylesterase